MMRGLVIYSAFVLAIAGLVLAVIWCPDWFLGMYEKITAFLDMYQQIAAIREWAMSVVVVTVTLVLLLCRWCLVSRGRLWNSKQENSPCGQDQANVPAGASPYPNGDWKCIVEVRFETDLCLGRLKERDPRFGPEQQYIVTKDYIVHLKIDGNKKHSIKVPRGLVTDLASVPKPFRTFVGRVGPHLEAAIVHDYLYVAWQIHGLTPTDDMRRFSDKAMLEAMLESGMGCKAYIIYGAVRLFGACAFYKRNRKPRVLEDNKMPKCCCQN